MKTAIDPINGACHCGGVRFTATLTDTAKHYFCSRCGIYIHHQRRSNPRQYGVNVACLEGTSATD